MTPSNVVGSDVRSSESDGLIAAHPLRGQGYDFDVPLLDGDHVTDEAGTGFVHTAPGHGREDFDVWMSNGRQLAERGIETRIPYTVDADGRFTKDAPGFEGAQVITDKGEKGNANEVVIKALAASGNLVARGRLKHQYPHSWRSKKPVIFRNTPQWFIAMDKAVDTLGNRTLREVALGAIKDTQWVPAAGENRINGMIANRPDWVVSRQRAWGVPITVFVEKETKDILVDARVNAAIAEAFEAEGADAWFTDTDGARFLTPFGYDPARYERVTDVLDVWFDSGSTHAFTLEKRDDLRARRRGDGGNDRVMYLEGSDQHRGWFHSSLLESCGTRGRAPYDIVLTHGFCLDEKGEKMSKSKGNVTAPQDIIKDSGADILRLWVAAADYSDDLRIGKEILKTFVETYRKLRNTTRWMLGTLAHFSEDVRVAETQTMPELERLMLHRLAELGPQVEEAYATYDYKKVVNLLSQFMNTELSAFYFDIRKDALYCDPLSSHVRKSALTVVDHLFRCLATWLAPILVFTTEEAWLERYPEQKGARRLGPSRALRQGARRLARPRAGRALEQDPPGPPRRHRRARARARRQASSAPRWRPPRRSSSRDPDLRAALSGADLAEISITSGIRIESGRGAGRGLPPARRRRRRRRPASRRRREMRPLVEVFRSRDGRPRLSRRDAARRQGAARAGARALMTPNRRLGLAIAVIVFGLDQALQALAALRRRAGRERPVPGPALHGHRAGLEPRHLLRAVPAIQRGRPLGPGGDLLRRRHLAGALDVARDEPGRRGRAGSDHRRRAGQRRRSGGLRRGRRLRSPALGQLQLVHLQHRRCRHRCRGGRPAV